MNTIGKRVLATVMTVPLLAMTGCGTIFGRDFYRDAQPAEDPPKVPPLYSGTRFDCTMIGMCVTGASILHEGGPFTCFVVGPLFFTMDIPVSVVTDTLLLPFDIHERVKSASNTTSDGIRQPAGGSPKPSR